MTEEARRKDDSFLRKTIIAVVTTIVIQAGGWIYLLGTLVKQVEQNTNDIKTIKNVDYRLIRIEVKMDSVVDSIGDLKSDIKEIRK